MNTTTVLNTVRSGSKRRRWNEDVIFSLLFVTSDFSVCILPLANCSHVSVSYNCPTLSKLPMIVNGTLLGKDDFRYYHISKHLTPTVPSPSHSYSNLTRLPRPIIHFFLHSLEPHTTIQPILSTWQEQAWQCCQWWNRGILLQFQFHIRWVSMDPTIRRGRWQLQRWRWHVWRCWLRTGLRRSVKKEKRIKAVRANRDCGMSGLNLECIPLTVFLRVIVETSLYP